MSCLYRPTGGPDLQGSLPPDYLAIITYTKIKKKKKTNRTFVSPFLLRQVEPGTSQYQATLAGELLYGIQ